MFVNTPGSINSVFSDLFMKFQGVILGVFGTILGEETCGKIRGEKPSEVVKETI